MNINIAQSTFKSAQEQRAAGNHFQAATLFLAAQVQASHCKSNRRRNLWDYAHAGACREAAAVINSASSTHKEKSDAGRIAAESQFRYSEGL